MSMRIITSILVAVVITCGLLVAVAPDFVAISLVHDDARARLIRDDHELQVFHQRGSWVTRGITPYDTSIFQEYPQAGLAYITLPYVFGEHYGTYRWILISMNTLALVGLLLITLRSLKRLHRTWWYSLLLLLPSILYFSFSRFDVLVAFVVQLGMLLILSRRWRWAAVIFALAFLIKWYPIIFLPLIYIYIKQTEAERAKQVMRQFFGIGLTIVVSALAISFAIDGITSLRPYLFHGARAGGVGSLYFMLVQEPLLTTGIEQLNYLGLTIFLLLQISLPLYTMLQWRVLARWFMNPKQLILWMGLAAALFTLFSRFYSPQWILWFVPLLILIADKKLVGIIISYDILNYLSFPIIWQVWGPFSLGYRLVSLAITIVLVIMVYRIFLLILDKNEIDQVEKKSYTAAI